MMKSTKCEGRLRESVGSAVVRLCAALLVVFAVAGCGGDNRISMEEFLEIQQRLDQAPGAPDSETAAARTTRIDQQLGPYKVGPADVLTVTVIGGGQAAQAVTVQVRVCRDGTIELPLVGRVKVADMELEDVEQAIKKAYLGEVYQQATVIVVGAAAYATSVLVTGAVTSPGLVKLRRNQRSLLFAIVSAGGVSSMASGRVTLCRIRSPEEKVTLDLTDPEGVIEALGLAPLEDGDMVAAEAAEPNTVCVGGLVNAPRPQTYPPGVRVTVLQAIAAAAGLRTDVFPKEATLIRRMPDGQDVYVKLDLDRLTTGKDANIALAAGDILWVPHTLQTRFQEWVSRNIYVRGGINTGLTYNFIHSKDILKEGPPPSILIGGGP